MEAGIGHGRPVAAAALMLLIPVALVIPALGGLALNAELRRRSEEAGFVIADLLTRLKEHSSTPWQLGGLSRDKGWRR